MKHTAKKLAAAAAALATLAAMTLALACSGEGWSRSERETILGQGEVMRILTVESASDSALLREQCRDISVNELNDNIFRELSRKMVTTLTDTDGGVGIAGPQVGVSRRIVVVQRFDKEGYPLEVYPNIRITARRGEPVPGPEGCLSVPDRRGNVSRYQEIDISYTTMPECRDTTETIHGFTAVIFQHECDHLDGVLYTDYLN
ncbi:MAG: peptide deformylase [Candidatus Cryptobacteroides sp.]